jgi:hypothetical protein
MMNRTLTKVQDLYEKYYPLRLNLKVLTNEKRGGLTVIA